MTKKIVIDQSELSWNDLKEFNKDITSITVDASVFETLTTVRNYVEEEINKLKPIYGVNTGFGRLASVQIPQEKLEELQVNLIRSHAAGVGNAVDNRIVRLMIFIKVKSLSKGYSGIRPEVLKAFVFMLNKNIVPHIPEQGSVGASGDLAPLSHMTLPLLHEGEVYYEGKKHAAGKLLKSLGMERVTLKAKEGLAIINGTQSMVAHGIYALILSERLLNAAELIATATIEAMKASKKPFFAGIHKAKGSPHNEAVAERILSYLSNSKIMESHKDCDKVQDPYSIRCIPQVFGAIHEAFEHVKHILVREANAVSDNPLIFKDEDVIVSGGNFHGESPALVMDYLAMAMSELGSISERRTANLVDKNMSDLPAFLVENGGVNSGYMIAHVTAAALVSENKGLATPSCVDSIPTSANQEDHVSMGHRSGVKLLKILNNVSYVLAIELLSALQGIEFRRPDRSSETIENLYDLIRKDVPYWDKDRQMNYDIEKVREILIRGDLDDLLKINKAN